jgi:hypothetical protein
MDQINGCGPIDVERRETKRLAWTDSVLSPRGVVWGLAQCEVLAVADCVANNRQQLKGCEWFLRIPHKSMCLGILHFGVVPFEARAR